MTTVRPIGDDYRQAFSRGEAPAPERVRDDVLAVPLEMPGSRLGFSLAYLCDEPERGELHLVDTGIDTAANRRRLAAAAQHFGRGLDALASITITHVHADHAALAAHLRAATGAAVQMHAADAAVLAAGAPFFADAMRDPEIARWRAPADAVDELRRIAAEPATKTGAFTVDRALAGGETLHLGRRRFEALHVPGHTGGHLALLERSPAPGGEAPLVFTGDHVLPVINPGVGLGGRVAGDRPLTDYFASLRRLRAQAPADAEACPGHGYRFTGLAARCDEIAAHHERRSREVAAVLGRDPGATIWRIAAQLSWSAGWEGLTGFTRFSALAQTAMHVDHLAGRDEPTAA